MEHRISSRVAILGCLALGLALLPIGCESAQALPAIAGSPTVAGPITGGNGVVTVQPAIAYSLEEIGYEELEFFVGGTASAYAPTAPLTSDGKWAVTPSTTAPYITRIVVRRPIDEQRFNGSVVVEWLNVTGGVDAAPDWTMTHNLLARRGYAWIGVSAQAVGVTATKNADPVRYAWLSHPGDSYSYDIFSQAGQVVRDHGTDLLDGLTPRTIIAVGESQSAGRLVTYINAVHRLARIYDGYLVHSRFATGAPLSQAPEPEVLAPPTTRIREGLLAPVLVFETETDVIASNLADRQPDTNRFRLWEVAGTAHFDAYGLMTGVSDTGDGQGAIQGLASMQNPPNDPPPGIFGCDFGINTGGQHWVLQAALHSLNRWVVQQVPPAIAPRLRTLSSSPVVLAQDANGLAIGGVRSPQVDAPIAVLAGTGNGGSGSFGRFCGIFGRTVPFTQRQLHALYPNHEAFATAWRDAAQRAVLNRFLLVPDAHELVHAAIVSDIGR